MGPVEELARSAGVAIQRVGGLVLVPTNAADRMLDAFEYAGLRVLGAEGFRLSGSEVRPDMDIILDISDVEDRHKSIREVRRFVELTATPDLLFEFVVDEQAPAP